MPINRNAPPPTGLILDSELRGNFNAIADKIDTLPENYSAVRAGTLLALNDTSTGPTVATTGAEPLSGGHRQLGRMKPWAIDVANSISLTTNNHEGALLIARNSGGIVLQLELNASASAGVQHLFSCTILRPTTSGSVQISSSTLVNDHPSAHTRVGGGQMVTIFVDGAGGRFYLLGATLA